MTLEINEIGVRMVVAPQGAGGTPVAPLTPTRYSSPGFTSQTSQSLSATRPPGSSLPPLSYPIRGSSAFYPSSTAFNGLAKFRNIAGGSTLQIPPLIPA